MQRTAPVARPADGPQASTWRLPGPQVSPGRSDVRIPTPRGIAKDLARSLLRPTYPHSFFFRGENVRVRGSKRCRDPRVFRLREWLIIHISGVSTCHSLVPRSISTARRSASSIPHPHFCSPQETPETRVFGTKRRVGFLV